MSGITKAVWVGLFGVCLGLNAASLSTTYANNNQQNGKMFDVVAQQSVRITGLSLNLRPGTHNIEIYGRPGTWVGFNGSSAGWTLLGTASSVTSNGNGVATPIPLTLNIVLGAGQRYALYATSTGSPSIGVNYTNGSSVGTVAAQDAYLQILEGAGIEYPFSTSFTPRIPNVTITYDPAAIGIPTLQTWVLMLLAAAMGLMALHSLRRQRTA
jgi:hypothetical protein